MAKSEAPAHLAIAISLLGNKEIKGPKSNPIIAGSKDDSDWFAVNGHPEVDSDETANCAVFVGFCLVKAGFPIPPRDNNMLARSYCTYGVDAIHDPRPGDIGVLPRGAKWQGHVIQIAEVLGGGRLKCIGANQSDTVSYAEHRISEFIAIRRPVKATAKALRKAGSTEIKTGDLLQHAGTAAAVAPPVIIAAGKVADAMAQSVDPGTVEALHQAATKSAEHLQLFNSVGEAASSAGMLFVANPWIVGCMIMGIVVVAAGYELKRRRVAKAAAGAPLSSQLATA